MAAALMAAVSTVVAMMEAASMAMVMMVAVIMMGAAMIPVVGSSETRILIVYHCERDSERAIRIISVCKTISSEREWGFARISYLFVRIIEYMMLYILLYAF